MTLLTRLHRTGVAMATLLLALSMFAAADASAANDAPSTAGSFAVSVVAPNAAAPPPYFTLKVRAGSTTRRQVLVTNSSDAAMSFHVSPVDGLTGKTSGSVYANRQDPVHKAGAWVTPAVTTLTVPAHRARKVDFVVKVPEGETAGQHLAGIAVENKTAKLSGKKGFQIKQVLRTVVGVLVTVPGKTAFVASLTSLGISNLAGPDVAAVQVGLGNTGTRLAKPKLTLVLAGPDGYQRTVTRRLDTILPGDAIVYPYAWSDRLQSGSYDVTATLADQRSTVTLHRVVQLGKTLPGTATKPVDTASGGGSGIPWVLLLAVLAVGLGGGVLLRRRPPHAGSPA